MRYPSGLVAHRDEDACEATGDSGRLNKQREVRFVLYRVE